MSASGLFRWFGEQALFWRFERASFSILPCISWQENLGRGLVLLRYEHVSWAARRDLGSEGLHHKNGKMGRLHSSSSCFCFFPFRSFFWVEALLGCFVFVPLAFLGGEVERALYTHGRRTMGLPPWF